MTPEQYQARRARKAERYRELSDKAETRSNIAYARSKALTAGIPFGEPIKIGHHSERRHRNALDKSWNAMGKSVEESKKAEYYADKAEAAENSDVIFSDDPEAVIKLREKISTAEAVQAKMVKVNALVRKKDLEGVRAILGDKAESLFKPDFAGRIGFPDYELRNNNGNISRMKKRLAELEKTTARSDAEYDIDGVRVLENVSDNRLQLYFSGKPPEETRSRCKRYGFKWSPTNGCWQRQLNTLGNNARYYAEKAIRA